MKECKLGLVSIVMPCFNAEAFVGRAIESVIGQSYPLWELFVINDASIDGSQAKILSYAARDTRLKVIDLAVNVGVACARNEGIARASGEWIGFLDADDYWLPHKLECQLSAVSDTNSHCVFGEYNLIDAQDCFLGNRTSPAQLERDDLLRHNFIGNLTGMYRQSAVGKVMQMSVRHEDYLMWLTVLQKTNAIRPSGVLASYRRHGNNLTSNRLRSLLWHWKVLGFAGVAFPKRLRLLASHLAIKGTSWRNIRS